ncbi:hypothetical protein RQP46_005935 [Phenoliferia psychrophenolica]
MSPAPSVGSHLVVTFEENGKVLVLRLNRPKQLNSMTVALEGDLRKVLDWAEEEPSIWCIVVTGTGRIFCAGQDLKEALQRQDAGGESFLDRSQSNPHGFASLARRISRKPLIVAMNGSAFGGGAELIVNCDIIIGCEGQSEVTFPEVRRGVVASVGGIPNLMLRSPAMSPWLLAGLPIPQHLLKAHVFTEVVASAAVMPAALKWAKLLIECSPDAVQTTKGQINLFKAGKGVNEVVLESAVLDSATYSGDNLLEGLRAFGEKRAPAWSNPPAPKAKL